MITVTHVLPMMLNRLKWKKVLTLNLLESKVISPLSSVYTGRQARCAVWPGSILLAEQLQILILNSLKIVMESSKNGSWISPFKKYSRLRVKTYPSIKENITILHWLLVKTGKSGSRVTVYGGNEALLSYRFKELPECQISWSSFITAEWYDVIHTTLGV